MPTLFTWCLPPGLFPVVTGRVYYWIYIYRSANQASVFPKQQERLQLDRLKNQLSDAIQRYGAVQKVRVSLASTLLHVSLGMWAWLPGTWSISTELLTCSSLPLFLLYQSSSVSLHWNMRTHATAEQFSSNGKIKKSVLLPAVYLVGPSVVPLD